MSTIVKYVVGHTYKPLLEKYLSRKRSYSYNGFKLEIPPEVFHPGFFFSTRFLMRYLGQLPLEDKSLLELGAGSGLIAIHAAKEGAMVTATDLNQTAVEYLKINASVNEIKLNIIHSDLFENLPAQQFDFIVLNPPYYKRDALNEKDLAWCCGSNGEYFERLFAGIGRYMHANSEVLMVLCDGCDLQMIKHMARLNGFAMDCAVSKKNLIETNYIFNIRKNERLNSHLLNNNNVLTGAQSSSKDFAQLYIALRRKENRIYSDQQLAQLPFIESTHPLSSEWGIRGQSADKLISFLTTSGKSLKILEVGCGNGWLSNRLATIPGSHVLGIDINELELDQARRVFGEVPNLQFLKSFPSKQALESKEFDVIVFAASIQYFEQLEEIIDFSLKHLNAKGQIHIIDSYFYKQEEIDAARQRSRDYFANIGFPSMAKFYFHHSIDSIKKFKHKILHDPGKAMSRLFQKKRVFPWIMIEHE